ncbi:MAG TPA: HAMP domain-containing protein, partial [Kofleriaceae bacterium]|nr:HAMP domain-containing protein [Kofleriaceae bacterium]
MRFPGTLSARIIVGFAVLIVTFGGISLSAVLTTDQLNRSIRVIRIGYLQLALETRDLADRQDNLVGYLRDELAGESSPRRAETRIKRLLASRERLLGQLEQTLARVDDIPAIHRDAMDDTRKELGDIRRMIGEAEPLYAELQAAPPLERLQGGPGRPGINPARAEAGALALRKVIRHENRITQRTNRLEGRARNRVQDTARQLERASQKMRLLTIIWGAAALFLGALITVWATVNLRPLRRLRDAAREIARGDYGQRIDERGPREVADLARE